jgi:hypothetical protein
MSQRNAGSPAATRAVFWPAIQLRESSNSFKTPLPRSGRILVKAMAVPALARTSEILVADLGDRTRDLSLRAIAQLDDRQTGAWRREAEQTQRIFQGSRVLFGE